MQRKEEKSIGQGIRGEVLVYLRQTFHRISRRPLVCWHVRCPIPIEACSLSVPFFFFHNQESTASFSEVLLRLPSILPYSSTSARTSQVNQLKSRLLLAKPDCETGSSTSLRLVASLWRSPPLRIAYHTSSESVCLSQPAQNDLQIVEVGQPCLEGSKTHGLIQTASHTPTPLSPFPMAIGNMAALAIVSTGRK